MAATAHLKHLLGIPEVCVIVQRVKGEAEPSHMPPSPLLTCAPRPCSASIEQATGTVSEEHVPEVITKEPTLNETQRSGQAEHKPDPAFRL